ncbi:MAG TPA: LytTR family DNA-binding domain-containing protein [Bacteroidales bacterium]|nr:LytTR family DNA-binding domain-containing protein [Bacteroidales bacterium]HSA43652.1 LytTR family DNA-binding domain-containing protein [Bacteroidales bacterium]
MTPKLPFLNAVVIEDDKQARDALIHLLSGLKQIRPVGSAGSVEEGLLLLLKLKPDIAFLDIELSDGTAFELLDRISPQDALPRIIFTTVHDHYAIRAFKYAAFDYLLKPMQQSELNDCIDRMLAEKQKESNREQLVMLLQQISPPGKIRFNVRSGFIMVDPDDILYLLADSNYSEIFFSPGQSELVTTHLGKMEEILPPGRFFRISRSVIVNLKYLKRVNTMTCSCTLLKDGKSIQLPCSLKQIMQLKKLY